MKSLTRFLLIALGVFLAAIACAQEKPPIETQPAAAGRQRLSDEELEHLIGQLEDQDRNTRARAVERLGQIGDPRAVEPLIVALEDPEERVRLRAARVLGSIGDVRAVAPLVAALKRKDLGGRKRGVVARALRDIGSEDAMAGLYSLLTDPDRWRRQTAAEILGEMGDTEGRRMMMEMLKEEDVGARIAAINGLGRATDAGAVAALVAALEDEDAEARFEAIRQLARKGDPRALEPLIRTLENHPGEGVRTHAIKLLGEMRDARAVDALIRALTSEEPWVSFWAAAALGRIGDRRAVRPLIETLEKKPNQFMHGFAIDALGEIGDDRAVPTLVALLDSIRWREDAAKTLPKIGWEPASRSQKILYLVGMRKWREAGDVAPWASPVEGDPNRVEGPIEFDIPIFFSPKEGLRLIAPTDVPSPMGVTPWVRFQRIEGRIRARIEAGCWYWPTTRWKATVSLLNGSGELLDRAQGEFANKWVDYAHWDLRHVIHLVFDQRLDVSEVDRFILSIERK